MDEFFIGLLILFAIFSFSRMFYYKKKLNAQGEAILRSMNREDLIPQLDGTMNDIKLFHPSRARKKKKCFKCNEDFMSKGTSNRMCGKCAGERNDD